MNRIKFFKTILVFGGVFNFTAAAAIAFPESFGTYFELPSASSIFYTSLLSFVIAVYGGSYIWMALAGNLNRVLLYVCAIGKTGVFVISFYCFWVGAITFKGLVGGIGDLIFAIIFFWWLQKPLAEKMLINK